ncbi:hypothetical protein NESM_000878100 [Novymonas esmeraldas]|uniref:Uncharacterized protein n=1 Tax=Novymonas esmeraldas TaxID=1808958 RepID=A0AAW0F112_9TRYP
MSAFTAAAAAGVTPLSLALLNSDNYRQKPNGRYCRIRPKKSETCNTMCKIIIGCVVGAVVLISLGVTLLCCLLAKRRREQRKKLAELDNLNELEGDFGPTYMEEGQVVLAGNDVSARKGKGAHAVYEVDTLSQPHTVAAADNGNPLSRASSWCDSKVLKPANSAVSAKGSSNNLQRLASVRTAVAEDEVSVMESDPSMANSTATSRMQRSERSMRWNRSRSNRRIASAAVSVCPEDSASSMEDFLA